MRYRKKPVVIEAFQVGKGEEPEWLYTGERKVTKNIIPFCDVPDEYCKVNYDIETLEGTMRASWGDFIIKGVNGELYPCKPDIFEKTYEVAE